jgi:hypothetical protein
MYYPATKAAVYVTDPDAAPLTLTNEATTANSARTLYTITNDAHVILDEATAVTVEKSTDGGNNYSAVTTGFHIHCPAGQVAFDSAQAEGTLIRISGKYVPFAELEATGWSTTESVDIQEITPIHSASKVKYAQLHDAQVTIDRFTTNHKIENLVGRTIYLGLYTDVDTAERYMCKAILKQVSDKVQKGSLMGQSLSFEISGDLYQITG